MVPSFENPAVGDQEACMSHKSWIQRAELCGVSTVNLYLASMEFASMTLVMSYGWIYPATPSERLFALLAMLCGGTLYAYVIGTVCQLLSMRDPATKGMGFWLRKLLKTNLAIILRAEYNSTRDLLVSYMEENQFPSELKRR